ncbi:hypothetical protein Vretifemale_14524 [Volvox reticuliferus]|uniref:Uncharacterized protein n=1 Tax=Volvox reticuliferus TaxID=1737510 RepID=A0A8J4CRL8_9CHLO|nr:hypothetical protein Vretifemale_14524 [Volvox reticuliferus]
MGPAEVAMPRLGPLVRRPAGKLLPGASMALTALTAAAAAAAVAVAFLNWTRLLSTVAAAAAGSAASATAASSRPRSCSSSLGPSSISLVVSCDSIKDSGIRHWAQDLTGYNARATH